jgi:hypothetical protein
MILSKPLPPITRLRELFRLDEETGQLFHLPRARSEFELLSSWAAWTARFCGKQAGWQNKDGYRKIWINGKLHRAHRIVFALATGVLLAEQDQIDHIDGNPANERPSNLRLATHGENQRNTKRHIGNSTGFKGVFPHRKKFAAQIKAAGVRRCLGSFDTPEEAHAAYVRAARELHGEFARAE